MIEIVDILILFFLFTLFVSSPFGLFNSNIGNFKIQDKSNLYFNLLINLNILLLLSILPLKLSDYINYVYFILIFFFVKNYMINFKFKNLKLFYTSFIVFILIYFIISIDISNKLNLSWDTKWFWYIKSLYYFQDNTYAELSNYTFNDFHPHFGSYIWAFFKKLSINQHEYYGRLFYLFLYLISLIFISNNFFNKNLYNLIIFLLLIIISYKYYYFSGLQEVLLFSFLIIVSKLVLNYIFFRNIVYLFFIAISLNLILWIKAEGIAFLIITVLCINFIKRLDFKHRIKFNFFIIFLVIFKVLIFNIFNIKLNNQPYYFDYIMSLNFDILAYKIVNILSYLAYYSLTNIIFFILPIVFLLRFKKMKLNEFDKFNFLFYVLNILFIFSAYLFRDMEVVYSLKTTIDRLIFTSSGFYLLYIINYFKKISFRLYKF